MDPLPRLVAALSLVVLTASTLVACTPKPVSAEPIVNEFLEHWQHQEFAEAGELTDSPEQVSSTLASSWGGLQAERVETTLDSLQLKDTIATATYQVRWQLPRERSLEYQATMTLNRINEQWKIRWQPTALHPRLGANQHLELRAINAERARIISSDGADVLVPGSVFRILVDTSKVRDTTSAARAIAGTVNAAHQRDETIAQLDPKELAATLSTASGIYSVTTVSAAQGEAVQQALAATEGVFLNEEAAMVPTDPGFAPDVVARITKLVDADLNGANGWEIVAANEHGARIETLDSHAPKPAPAVTISLDHNVQLAAEEAVNLRADMQTMLVAIRPSTGEILAIAQTDKADEAGDLALMGQYPPGSTFKILTAYAGMRDQGLNPGSVVPCPGSMNIYGRIVNNYNGFSLGNVPLERAFAASCNTTFANISTALEQGHLKEVGREFGIGVDYDIAGLSTITGSIPEGQTPLEKTEAGYGQGLTLVSPFGMALVAATAAAGKTPVPRLVTGHDTTQDIQPATPDPAVIDQLRQLMRAVVTGGTAAGMRAGGEIYGKTGEAEINEGSHAWFTGYRDDLAFATLVVLGGGSETSVAITDRFLQRLDELNAGPQQPQDLPPQ